MSILDKIVAFKRVEVLQRQASIPVDLLQESPYFMKTPVSLAKSLVDNAPGIIAEFKRKSPSREDINRNASPSKVISGYSVNGAAGISVLTDQYFFGARPDDFPTARESTSLPILRKEFIIDPYQVFESRAMGADAILLIGAVLSLKDSQALSDLATDLGLEVIYEIRDVAEMNKIPESATIIGVNNRDLKTFEVDFNHSIRIFKHLPSGKTKITESGLTNSEAICTLRNVGYHGFLIGEYFMKDNNPGQSLARLLSECKNNRR